MSDRLDYLTSKPPWTLSLKEGQELTDLAHAQAEQLRELRERMEKIKARSDPNREQRQSEPQIVLDSIYAHACAALARGGTTE